MAGFWTGLVHGTLMCGATLAAVSLAVPRQDARRDAPRADGNAASAPVASGVGGGEGASMAPADRPASGALDAAGTPARPAQGDVTAVRSPVDQPRAGSGAGTPVAAARPALQPLPDPVGSDFRRGSDDPPRAPAALPAPPQGTAPRSLAAGPEPAPAPAAIPADSPRVPVAPAAPAGIALPPAPEPLDRPQGEAPVTPAQPGRVARAAPDALPRPSQPVPGTADLSDGPADAGSDAVIRGVGEAAGAGRAAPAATFAKDRDSAPDAPGEAADGLAADRQPSVPPEAPAPSDLAGLAPSDAAPATQAIAASPSSTDAPAQPLDAPEDRPAVIDTLPGRQAAPAADPADAPAAEPRLSLADPAPPAATRAPRPAPDLSIPRALFAPSAARRAPALPQPAGATPPAPDLSDLLPEGSR